ncbi:sel1 repeat family protein [Vibrio injensis]|uniref:sel1 repeat family protein n=2 Tax=Vibrio injensis TaxID=1307414 RepID=UPI00111538AF|nr:sel1 repeat family protein [Vibrio injensis]
MMITACKPNPQNDIPYFQAFIQENNHRIADDPYISSTVRPGDKMYEILVNIQRGNWPLVEELLIPLVESEDPEAMVWYARIHINNINKRRDILLMLNQSLAKGNPHAYFRLSSQAFECLYYLKSSTLSSDVAESLGIESVNGGRNCSDEYFNLAIKGFEQLAEQGDLRAQYFLLQQKQWDQSTKTREQYLNEVIRFAKAHYYQPLMDYIDTILILPQGSNKYQSKTPEQNQLALELLTIAANHNYTPAINKLIQIKRSYIKKNNDLIQQGVQLGSTKTISRKYTLFTDFVDLYPSQEQYFDALLFKKLTDNNRLIGFFEFDGLKLADKEKQAIEYDVDTFIKTITPMVYIDGFTHQFNWVEQP